MKIRKTEQSIIPNGIELILQGSSCLECGTEIKLTVSKRFETKRSADMWYLLKREIVRTVMLNLEKVCKSRRHSKNSVFAYLSKRGLI
ncbi:MAG: hypothetical protein NUV86_01870 [Candidatus Scalindua sp.]|nr:hypothetical protein [Candidatus Scalindua sp.]